jgi:hypothetical protein
MPSPVVALTLTAASSVPSDAASDARIASRCGPTLGRSAITVASTLTTA